MIKLFVEKPRNSFGYRIYSPVVIQAASNGVMLFVLSPKDFDGALLEENDWQEVSFEAGPTRIPTSQETNNDANKWRDEMIKKFGVGN